MSTKEEIPQPSSFADEIKCITSTPILYSQLAKSWNLNYLLRLAAKINNRPFLETLAAGALPTVLKSRNVNILPTVRKRLFNQNVNSFCNAMSRIVKVGQTKCNSNWFIYRYFPFKFKLVKKNIKLTENLYAAIKKCQDNERLEDFIQVIDYILDMCFKCHGCFDDGTLTSLDVSVKEEKNGELSYKICSFKQKPLDEKNAHDPLNRSLVIYTHGNLKVSQQSRSTNYDRILARATRVS